MKRILKCLAFSMLLPLSFYAYALSQPMPQSERQHDRSQSEQPQSTPQRQSERLTQSQWRQQHSDSHKQEQDQYRDRTGEQYDQQNRNRNRNQNQCQSQNQNQSQCPNMDEEQSGRQDPTRQPPSEDGEGSDADNQNQDELQSQDENQSPGENQGQNQDGDGNQASGNQASGNEASGNEASGEDQDEGEDHDDDVESAPGMMSNEPNNYRYPLFPGYMDNVVGPSPAAAHVAKYADTPISYSLGLADITIPIYTIKTRELEMPITLSYHASGIKVDEFAGPVGLGWSLNAGGAVTKTVVGLADYDIDNVNHEHKFLIPTREQLTPKNKHGKPIDSLTLENPAPDDMLEYLQYVVWGRADNYRDRFNYSYCGNSGSFLVEYENGKEGLTSKVKKTAMNDDIIYFDGSDEGLPLIRDSYGNKYEYNECEEVERKHRNFAGYSNRLYQDLNYKTKSSWFLTKMESFNGTDNITLKYKDSDTLWTRYSLIDSRPYYRKIGDIHNRRINQQNDQPTGFNESDRWISDRWKDMDGSRYDPCTGSETTYEAMQLISQIEFDGGSVKFEYESQNKNIWGPLLSEKWGNRYQNKNIPNRLSKIEIIENGKAVKVFKLRYTYAEDGRTMLADIDVEIPDTPGGDIALDSYSFSYNGTLNTNDCSQDQFGYYNGKKNVSLCQMRLFEFETDQSDERKYSFEHAQSGTLSEIQTRRGVNGPVKTKTCFIYEPNRHTLTYPEDMADEPLFRDVCIGLRIKRIDTYNYTGTHDPMLVKSRKFTYFESDCTIDFTKIQLKHYLSRSQSSYSPVPEIVFAEQCLTFSNNSVLPGAAPENARVYYNRVVEDIIDGQDPKNTVRVEYRYDCDDSKAEIIEINKRWSYPFEIFDSPFKYRTDPAKLDIYNFIWDEDRSHIIRYDDRYNSTNFKWWTYVIIPFKAMDLWLHPQLLYCSPDLSPISYYFMAKTTTFNNLINKVTYKIHNNKYIKAEEEINEYRKFNTNKVRTGLYVENLMSDKNKIQMSSNHPDSHGKLLNNFATIKYLPNDCFYFDVYEEVSAWKLMSSKRIKYFDGEINIIKGGGGTNTLNANSDDAGTSGDANDTDGDGNVIVGSMGIGDMAPIISPKSETTYYDYYGNWRSRPIQIVNGKVSVISQATTSGNEPAGKPAAKPSDEPTGESEDDEPTGDLSAESIGSIGSTGGAGHELSPLSLLSFQPKTVVRYVDGDIYKHCYSYPPDFTAAGEAYADMKAGNNLYTVVEEKIVKNNADSISVRTNFKNIQVPGSTGETHPIPKPFERVKNVNGNEAGRYEILKHDRFGNPACVSENGMAPTVYIWGYGGRYPVAEIKNATYQQVRDELTASVIDNITKNKTLYAPDIRRLKRLRNDLPNALITVFTYKPLTGITSITDPSGRTTTYQYDAAGRLDAIKDPDGKIVETYEYK